MNGGCRLTLMVGLAMVVFLGVSAAYASESIALSNESMRIELGLSEAGIPEIKRLVATEGDQVLLEAGAKGPRLGEWLPAELLSQEKPACVWRVKEEEFASQALASLALPAGIEVTWKVVLPKSGELLQLSVDMRNTSQSDIAVTSYPIWHAQWRAPGKTDWLKGWTPLTFGSFKKRLTSGKRVSLGSRLHSSEQGGQNPYWILGGDTGSLYCALAWSGGWKAKVALKKELLNLHVYLPPEECQLVLHPGEAIRGPVMSLFPTEEQEERKVREAWLKQRVAWGHHLYGDFDIAYPFAYNNWYTTRFDFDGAFIQTQFDHMKPYDFDAFVVDAGWYEACGQWTPDPKKFEAGHLEGLMKSLRAKGILSGIWTCPQFVKAEADKLPPEVDQPGFYRDFIDGYLLDYVGMDFSAFLVAHVASMIEQFDMQWWKYDQDFFTAETRHGVMKNVHALQDALLAVRKAYPDLLMENCQSGGRMINEVTTLMTQNQWIHDGGATGIKHARGNFSDALGALQFMPPWTVNRWLNNPDQNDPEDAEFMRMYCRSCMAGTWGLVADLSKVDPRHEKIILEERDRYRRLNTLKSAMRYDIYPMKGYSKATGIGYFNASGDRAGILLLRWGSRKEFTFTADMKALNSDHKYCVEDVDTGVKTERSGADLQRQGLSVSFDEGRQSALIFVDALEGTEQ